MPHDEKWSRCQSGTLPMRKTGLCRMGTLSTLSSIEAALSWTGILPNDIHSNNCNRLQQLFPLFYRCPLLACSLASLAAPWLLPGCCLAAAPPRESRDQPGKPGSSHGCQQPGSSQTDQDQLAAKEPSYSISTVYLQFIYSVSYSLSTVYLIFP